MPATVMSPTDIAAANESPARSRAGVGGGVVEADERMWAMKGRPCRSIAACIRRSPRSVRPEAESGVLRRVIVPSWAMDSPVASAIRVASALVTLTLAAAVDAVPPSSRSSMSSAGVRPASVDPPPARPYAIAPASLSTPPLLK
jgi:hypothetical protein